MRILITGGAGCLGSNLVEHWLPQGHEILVLDNFATGKREVLPPMRSLQVIEGSVADAELVERAFRDFEPQLVVHSAAAYKDPANWRE
ncbi:MAG TPA: NAD-dependent epimerase/dehydratase family protein, partial [Burkholderiales bacterium]|nr:NAD-dependent epimerase/dehydratase family protein [Burkholderiales bacterium]